MRTRRFPILPEEEKRYKAQAGMTFAIEPMIRIWEEQMWNGLMMTGLW